MLAEASGPVKGRARIPSFHGEHAANRTITSLGSLPPAQVFHGKPSRSDLGGGPSPQRPASWNSHSPRPTLPRWSRRPQDGNSRSFAAAHLRAEQPQLIEPLLRPPPRVGRTRGLAHRQPSTLLEKAHRAFGCRPRGPKGPRYHELERTTKLPLPGQFLGSTACHRRAIRQIERSDGGFEKGAAASPRIQQDPRRRGPHREQDEAGNASTRAQVQESTVEVGVNGRRQRFGMVEMRLDGARPEHPP